MSRLSEPVAHTPRRDDPDQNWHLLHEHLVEVASFAERFAGKFDADILGKWLGLLHDIGKYNPDFQQYLERAHRGDIGRGPPHAVWGAAVIYHWLRPKHAGEGAPPWWDFTPPLAGHHGGLKSPSLLDQELSAKRKGDLESYVTRFLHLGPPELDPSEFRSQAAPIKRELFIRMLLSALVDADHLDTERHFDIEQFKARGGSPGIAELWSVFAAKQEAFTRNLDPARAGTEVNRVRRAIYDACVARADEDQGMFRLTVPTGGGKTRSGLAFALKHARKHGLDRVIVAIPYTSIIEQTARVYRDIFDDLGESVVLEHHSQVQASDHETLDEARLRQQLAAQNWDSPLIVTTTVQLFESLFSNRPSKVRKLHNIVNSVIVLDEAQTIPPELLEPTLDVLKQLVEEYGVTVVLSTATQPAFEDSEKLGAQFRGFPIREIVPDYAEHFQRLARVTYARLPDRVSWLAVGERIQRERQVLVIVNRRKDALEILDLLGDDTDVLHLSTLLCGAHRREVLAEVAERLSVDQPIRLISTQVVEAGVDLDFPTVYRAVGPLDRIVQAAGRCNREGAMPEKGKVIIFEPAEGGTPRGPYKMGLEIAEFMLRNHDIRELQAPDLYRTYFRRLYNEVDVDKKRIQGLRENLRFPETAKEYRMIDQNTVSVVVPYEGSEAALDAWRVRPNRNAWQQLQPFVVGIYEREAERLAKEALLEEATDGLYIWIGPKERGYDARDGFTAVFDDPSDLIVRDPTDLMQ